MIFPNRVFAVEHEKFTLVIAAKNKDEARKCAVEHFSCNNEPILLGDAVYPAIWDGEKELSCKVLFNVSRF